eukprot:SAG11_NODE_1266_length_5342_cov_4.156369_5_plen_265_part_00
MAVESGFLTCDADFCNTVPTIEAPCDLAGHCDRTCGFCTAQDDGNHRRLLMTEDVRRRAQFSLGTCDTANFAAMTAEVDEACCDPGTNVCATGVPGECDAKCAVIYNPFYQQCSRFISAQVGLAAMSAYDRLYSTCTSSLPSEPLLRVVALCGTRDRDPCFEVDCGEHGSCDGGACQCEQGYSGESCQVFDPRRVLMLIVGGMGNVLVELVNARTDILALIVRCLQIHDCPHILIRARVVPMEMIFKWAGVGANILHIAQALSA